MIHCAERYTIAKMYSYISLFLFMIVHTTYSANECRPNVLVEIKDRKLLLDTNQICSCVGSKPLDVEELGGGTEAAKCNLSGKPGSSGTISISIEDICNCKRKPVSEPLVSTIKTITNVTEITSTLTDDKAASTTSPSPSVTPAPATSSTTKKLAPEETTKSFVVNTTVSLSNITTEFTIFNFTSTEKSSSRDNSTEASSTLTFISPSTSKPFKNETIKEKRTTTTITTTVKDEDVKTETLFNQNVTSKDEKIYGSDTLSKEQRKEGNSPGLAVLYFFCGLFVGIVLVLISKCVFDRYKAATYVVDHQSSEMNQRTMNG